MKKYDLQKFADALTPVSGKKLIYLYRVLSTSSTTDGAVLAFTTENDRTTSKDADATTTKDGPIRTPSGSETEITASSLLAKGDTLLKKLEDAQKNDALIEIWEVNLLEPGTTENKFKAKYFQGYLTEIEYDSSAEDMVEVSLTFGVNGEGVDGEATVTADQQEVAAYVFKDTTKTGA